MRTLAFALFLGMANIVFAQEAKPSLPVPQELRLPTFQNKALAEDLPARDLVLEGDQILWVLGKSFLWRWDLEAQRLKRFAMHAEHKVDKSPLSRLHIDGSNLFAASRGSFYQIQLGTIRVFRFDLADGGKPFAFAGTPDETWLVNERGGYRFDRYGKSLTRRFTSPVFGKSDRVAFEPKTKSLWFSRGNKLMRLESGAQRTEPSSPKTVHTTKHALIDVQTSGSEILAHTAHTVLRFDQNGKVRQTLPVEGKRKLVLMRVDAARHGYVFNDRMLEIFDLKKRKSSRFRLPLSGSSKMARLRLGARTAALAEDGTPRVFRLPEL